MLNIDPADIVRKITPYTWAIIPVSLYGLLADYDGIMELVRQLELTVIEDNAVCCLEKCQELSVGRLPRL